MLVFMLSAALAGEIPNQCRGPESAVFACEVKGGKLLSLCLGPPAPNPTYMQYRFGPPGEPELEWPPDMAAGFAPFHLQTQAHVSSESTTVSFSNGKVTYEVFEQVGSGPENNGAGVSIHEDGKHLATVSCVGDVHADLGSLRSFVAEGDATAAVDPLKGLSPAQICDDPVLAMLKHPFDDLASDFAGVCCGPQGLSDGRCETDWPSSGLITCAELDAMRNGIFARYGRPFTTEAWKTHFGEQPWYVTNVNFQEDWVSEVGQANAALLKEKAEKKDGCFTPPPE